MLKRRERMKLKSQRDVMTFSWEAQPQGDSESGVIREGFTEEGAF